jgi:hypothetical protein
MAHGLFAPEVTSDIIAGVDAWSTDGGQPASGRADSDRRRRPGAALRPVRFPAAILRSHGVVDPGRSRWMLATMSPRNQPISPVRSTDRAGSRGAPR